MFEMLAGLSNGLEVNAGKVDVGKVNAVESTE